MSKLETWAVVVNDPGMSQSHEFIVEAIDSDAALDEGVKRAILADRRGAGVGLPPDDGTLVLTQRQREKQLQYAPATRGYASAVLRPDAGA